MSRPLLKFETAIFIEGGARPDWQLLTSLQILQEHHAPKRAHDAHWFNTDFYISTLEGYISGTHGSCVPSRPNSLGAEFFVVLDSNGIPISLELLDGESISKASFQEDIDIVASKIGAIQSLSRITSVKRAPYLRVARLKSSIAFVVSSTTDISALLRASAQPLDAEHLCCDLRDDGCDIMIDGIILD